MKDAECAETNEKSILQFFFSSYGHFYIQNMVNFRWIFIQNSKNKNLRQFQFNVLLQFRDQKINGVI